MYSVCIFCQRDRYYNGTSTVPRVTPLTTNTTESNAIVCNYSAPVGDRSIATSLFVCLCVCLSVCEHISESLDRFSRLFMRIPCGPGSVVLWRRCATSCTSSFMDDVTFGPYGASGVATPGQSLMFMNALFITVNFAES